MPPTLNQVPASEDSEENIPPSLFGLLFTTTPRSSTNLGRTERLPSQPVDQGKDSESPLGQADSDFASTEETSTVFSLFGSLFSATESPRRSAGRVFFTSDPDLGLTSTERGRRREERSWSDIFRANLHARRANRRQESEQVEPQPKNTNPPRMLVDLSPRRGGVKFKRIKVPANGRWRSRPRG